MITTNPANPMDKHRNHEELTSIPVKLPTPWINSKDIPNPGIFPQLPTNYNSVQPNKLTDFSNEEYKKLFFKDPVQENKRNFKLTPNYINFQEKTTLSQNNSDKGNNYNITNHTFNIFPIVVSILPIEHPVGGNSNLFHNQIIKENVNILNVKENVKFNLPLPDSSNILESAKIFNEQINYEQQRFNRINSNTELIIDKLSFNQNCQAIPKSRISKEERNKIIDKYRQKKLKRNYTKRILNETRQKVANSRIRLQGKFVDKESACKLKIIAESKINKKVKIFILTKDYNKIIKDAVNALELKEKNENP